MKMPAPIGSSHAARAVGSIPCWTLPISGFPYVAFDADSDISSKKFLRFKAAPFKVKSGWWNFYSALIAGGRQLSPCAALRRFAHLLSASRVGAFLFGCRFHVSSVFFFDPRGDGN